MNKTELYDISVPVCTYNSSWPRVMMTLRSILLQKGIKYQIVVADDGSEKNWFTEITELFAEYDFRDYVLIAKRKNEGTVRNELSCLYSCCADYVKLITPGDMLYGENVLGDWLGCIKSHNATVSFCEIACYKVIGSNQMQIYPSYANPQNVEAYREGGEALRETYLLCDDIATGVSMLAKREALLSYTELMDSKVKYVEDNAYRLMVYRGEKTCWYDGCAVLYEKGTGISTAGDIAWYQKINADWLATNRIMAGMMSDDQPFDKTLRCVFKAREMHPEKAHAYLSVAAPEVIAAKRAIEAKGVRQTPVVVKQDFLGKVLQGIKEW